MVDKLFNVKYSFISVRCMLNISIFLDTSLGKSIACLGIILCAIALSVHLL